MNIRYSDVVGRLFYNIGVTDEDRDMIDVHFTAGAHHHHLLKHCTSKQDYSYHLLRTKAHLVLLKSIIFLKGDFSKAVDHSSRGLERRESWRPTNPVPPDPDMFNSMRPDSSFGVGQPHASDFYLTPRLLTYQPTISKVHVGQIV